MDENDPLDPILGILAGLTYGPYREARGFLGNVGRWAKQNPREAAQLAAETAVDMSPAGAAKGLLYDTPRDLMEGRPFSAAFNTVASLLEIGAAPIAAVVGGVKKIDQVADLARATERSVEAAADAITAPNINTRIGTPEGKRARGQARLLDVMDFDSPRIQGTTADPIVAEASNYKPRDTGTSRTVQRLAESEEFEKALDRDFYRAQDLYGDAGLDWYELGPVKAAMEEAGGPFSFNDLNIIGAVMSAQAPVTTEIQRMAAAMYGLKRGMSFDELRDVYNAQASSGTGLLNMSGGLYDKARRSLDQGFVTTADPKSAAWKTPMYYTGRQGGGAGPQSLPPLDAHELQNAAQVLMQTPRLRRDAMRHLQPNQRSVLRQTHPESAGPDMAGLASQKLPLGNIRNYQALGEAYRRGAERHGLATPHQFQAGRWIGGGYHTGLLSDPSKTFAEILADSMTRSAQHFAGATSPREVRDYFANVMRGDEFRMLN